MVIQLPGDNSMRPCFSHNVAKRNGCTMCRFSKSNKEIRMEHGDDRRFCAKRPSPGSILLGLIPFTSLCFSVSLWDRVYPMVLGLPFNFFWLILWLLLIPLFMGGVCRL